MIRLLSALAVFGFVAPIVVGGAGASMGTPAVAGAARTPARSLSDYGAVLDGVANDRAALQQAIDAAAAAGGGTVTVPVGRTLLTGSFELKSNVTLQLEAGSCILGSTRREDYSEPCLLRARHAVNIAISGRGTIDGQGLSFMATTQPPFFEPKAWRPRLILFEDCHQALVTGITLRNSAFWTLHLAGCEDVAVRGISIRNLLQAPNCDGVDPDHSRNVRISDCSIECGDDAIVVKSSREFARYGPCENIVVTGCVLTTQDCALKIGTETVGVIRNIVFADCVIPQCHRGIGVVMRDEGSVENIVAHDIVIRSNLFYQAWWGGSEAVFVSARPRHPGGKVGAVSGLRFSHILAEGEAGVFIQGSETSTPQDITLDDVSVSIAKTTPWPSRIDLRPGTDLGEFGIQEKGVVIAGYHIRDARGVTLRDCSVHWAPHSPPSYGPALSVEHVDGFKLERFQGADSPGS